MTKFWTPWRGQKSSVVELEVRNEVFILRISKRWLELAGIPQLRCKWRTSLISSHTRTVPSSSPVYMRPPSVRIALNLSLCAWKVKQQETKVWSAKSPCLVSISRQTCSDQFELRRDPLKSCIGLGISSEKEVLIAQSPPSPNATPRTDFLWALRFIAKMLSSTAYLYTDTWPSIFPPQRMSRRCGDGTSTSNEILLHREIEAKDICGERQVVGHIYSALLLWVRKRWWWGWWVRREWISCRTIQITKMATREFRV